MQPRFETIPSKKLVGKRSIMSLADNKTFELWKSFMPMRKQISNKLNDDLISMQVYGDTLYFKKFNPNNTVEKWAAVEVANFDEVPEGLETFLLPS